MKPCWTSIALLAALATCGCARDPAHETPAATPAAASTPTPAPAKVDVEQPVLRIATLDGTPFDLAAERGRWVVVNFWATWCSPCLKEMPELSALDARRDDVRVIGLAYEEIEPADMQAFLKKHPVDYPIAIVDTYAPPEAFEVPRGLPMTHVIAPDGRVAKRIAGPVTMADIEAVIDAAPQAARS